MGLDVSCVHLPDFPCLLVFIWEKIGIFALGLLNQTLEVKLLFHEFCFFGVKLQNTSESCSNL